VPPAEVPEWVRHTVRLKPVAAADFAIPWDGGTARAIGLVTDQVVTESLEREPTVVDGHVVSDPDRDLVKLAVAERHLGTGRIGLGLVAGSGLRRGALASTVAHDAHNLVVVGAADDDMAVRAASRRGRQRHRRRGRRARCHGTCGRWVARDQPLDIVVAQSRACSGAAQGLGLGRRDPVPPLAPGAVGDSVAC
jgi:adenine deaminase